MIIQVNTYPSVRLFEGDVDSSLSVKDILNIIKKKSKFDDSSVLIVDRNQNFHRIPIDDQVNKYYDGKLGEIYRIMDGSSTRYRIVIPHISMPKDKQKAKVKQVTGILYASAYETLLTMLGDRGCNRSTLSKFSISRADMIDYYRQDITAVTIPDLRGKDILINHRKRAVYVVFLPTDNNMMTSRRLNDLKTMLVVQTTSCIDHYNRITGSKLGHITLDDINNDDDAVAAIAATIELIIVYNNEEDGTEISPDFKNKFYQAFPVQNLSFNVTKHIDQPTFTLLNSVTDRDEIRSMYAINGRTLSSEETLDSYSLRDGVRLMLI
jgi:hypothetical protein